MRSPTPTRRPLAPAAALPLLGLLLICPGAAVGQIKNEKYAQEDKFRQLEEILPTPNEARTASGAPGRGYWQQRADHVIDVELDDEGRRIVGRETITYTNASPDPLGYLWLQLDPNHFRPDSDAVTTATAPPLGDRVSFGALERLLARRSFDGGVTIRSVEASSGEPIDYTINKTMMRVDLPNPLRTGEQFVFNVAWDYAINDSDLVGGRTGFEFFEEDGNCIYEIAQWFPRMASYTDVNGWQHKQFLGAGEFTLEFGDYLVRITVPDDHVVSATGVLVNPEDVLKPEWVDRLEEAKTAEDPVFIVTPEEAKQNEKSRPSGKKTWIFRAENVRDFAFASSRKFIWDAQGHDVGDNRVMAMSFYPNEGEPLWSKYSTAAIIHTLDVYSRYTFEYPYPVAQSINGPVGGMEYPMICFNGPRPEEDGTYSERTKYGLISVIIHEVGHNYFPMIVNSDERQWTWMDEGINTFLQVLAEAEWEEDYPSRRGEPQDIVSYMRSTQQVPIMTNSETILQFGANAYAKPATALNILRESILGRELFDYAFKEYARRWKFKRPMPADLFRTLEDASGTDLDWFWRGWFYTTDHVDVAIDDVKLFTIDAADPEVKKALDREERDEEPTTLSRARNKDLPKFVDRKPELKDFYNEYDELDVTESDREAFERFLKNLSDEEKELLATRAYFYVVDLVNVGGLVMPVILELGFEDGTTEEVRIPAEIWRQDAEKVSKLLLTEKEVASITLDPHLETADIDLENNHWPPRAVPTRFELYKSEGRGGGNPMRAAREVEEEKEDGDDKTDKDAEEPEGGEDPGRD
ncbi:M1 family metallopeptidase [Tautonia plasticadhaerens]|uniref:Aminopeptidase N n=1 Tax=Tautonia plasticadhaerens TaxID=2527974 RepID=A0A518HD88_9BACT|nr:M1 family metallopeptidase [Tautonia plasticadhaerens]QDV38822.1 Aminopeptidase N [Tautonia plasticadhaerens]